MTSAEIADQATMSLRPDAPIAPSRMGQWRAWAWVARRNDAWWAAVVGVIAFALSAWQAGKPSLWFDEMFAVGLARQPLDVMWRYLWGQESQMTLYYVLLHLWMSVLDLLGAGQGEFMLRLPSLVFAALAAVTLYRIGTRWWGRTAGIVAALVFAANPVLLREAQEARGYALQVLLQTLAWYAFLAAIEAVDQEDSRERRRWWIAFAAMLALAVYAHIDTVVCALAFPIALGALAFAPASGAASKWRARARASILPFMASAAAVGLAIAPLAADAAIHGGANAWVAAATPRILYLIVRYFFLGGVWWVALPLGGFGLLALLPVTRPARIWQWLRPFNILTLAILAWLVVPFVLFYILPLHLFHWRYLVVITAPAALLIGIGAARIEPRAARLIATLILLAVVAALPPAYYAMGRDDYRTAGTWLTTRMQSGDGVVCWPQLYCSVPMSYYVPQLAPGNVSYPGEWLWQDNTPTDEANLNRELTGQELSNYLKDKQRVWMVFAPHGMTDPMITRDEQAERQQMAAAGFSPVPGQQITTPAVTVILYARNP